jgi:hypothetical protein
VYQFSGDKGLESGPGSGVVSNFMEEQQRALFDSWLTSIGAPSARLDRGIGISDLLPGRAISHVVEFVSAISVGRNRSQQERWAQTVNLAAGPNGKELGFIRVHAGGVRGLAKRLNVSHQSLWRDLGAWGTKGLIRMWKEPAPEGDVLVGIQVPFLTEWFQWIASNRHDSLHRFGGGASPRQIDKILHLALNTGSPIPPTIDGYSHASGLIRTLQTASVRRQT